MQCLERTIAIMIRPEPESSLKPYPIGASPENILQQPKNTITTRASAKSQELTGTLAVTICHRSRPRGGVGVGGGGGGEAAGASGGGGGGKKGSDLDP